MNSKFVHAKYLAVLLLGVVILLLVSFDAFSKDNETSIGGNGSIEINTSETIMKAITRYEDYETTCSREVYTGSSSTVCTGGYSETRCRKVAGVGEECWQETVGESCETVDNTRTEYYTCTQTRAYTDYVSDYMVFAKVFLTKKDSANDYDLNNCKVGVDLEANTESFYARCNEAIVRAKVLSRKETVESRDKFRDIKVELDFASIEGLNALKKGLNDLSFKNGVASFTSANLAEASNFKLSAKLVRNRFLLKDKVLFERELKASDYKVEALENGQFKVSVNLAKLTGLDATKKHTLTVELKTLKSVNVEGAINNPALSNSLSQKIVINE